MHSYSLPPGLQQAMQMATAFRKAGRTVEAVGVQRDLLVRYPKQPGFLVRLRQLLQRGDPDSALPMLEQARQRVPAYGLRGLLLAQRPLAPDRARDAGDLRGDPQGPASPRGRTSCVSAEVRNS